MGRLVEVDEVDLQRNVKAREFVESIWNNPEARKHLLKAQKVVKPDDPLVKDADKPDPIEERFAAMQKLLEEERKERREAEEKREQEAKLSVLKRTRDDGITELRKRGYMDEGIKAVEEIMEKKGLLDPLDAAKLFEADHPPPEPIRANHYGAWNFMEPGAAEQNDDLKKLIDSKGQSEALVDKMARDALNEFRGQARR